MVPSLSRVWTFAILALVGAGLLRTIDDPDLWWHLSTGREIWATGQIPTVEFSVFPLAGTPSDYHEWGYGLLTYSVLRAGGFLGLSVMNALLGALAIVLSAHSRPGRGTSAAVILSIAAGLAWMNYRLVYRPEVLLFAAVGAELFILERWLLDRKDARLWPIPLLALALTQCHPSTIILFIVLGPYLLQAIVEDRRAGRSARRVVISGLVTTAAMAGAASANPFGPKQLWLPLLALTDRTQQLLATVVEYQPVWNTPLRVPAVALLAASVVGLLVVRRGRLADWLLFLGFGALGVLTSRHFALFALVMLPAIADAVEALLAGLHPNQPRDRARPVALLALAGVLVAGGRDGAFGFGVRPDRFPVRAVQTLDDLGITGDLFGFYDHGAYLYWAREGRSKVAVDGRRYAHDAAVELHDRVFQGLDGYERILDLHRVNAVIAPATLPFSGKLVPLLPLLARTGRWVVASSEEAALLLVRKSAAPSATDLGETAVWEHAAEGAAETLTRYPERDGARLVLARALAKLGRTAEARAAYERYLERRPDDAQARAELARLF